MSRIHSLTAVRCAAVAGLALTAAVPAVATAAPAKETVHHTIRVHPGALAHGTTVKTTTVVTNPQSSVSDWWSKATIARVVRKGVDGGYERPYSSQGYRCVPTVTGNTASFVCTLRGGDVPTTIRLSFRAAYGS